MRQGEYRGTLFPYPEVVPATTYSASPMCRTMPGFSAGIKAKVGKRQAEASEEQAPSRYVPLCLEVQI